MNNDFLNGRLRRVVRRYQWFALWRKLSACWAAAALVVLALAWTLTTLGSVSPLLLPVVLAVTLGVIAVISVLHLVKPIDLRWIARKIEDKHPELNGVLLTAVQIGRAHV